MSSVCIEENMVSILIFKLNLVYLNDMSFFSFPRVILNQARKPTATSLKLCVYLHGKMRRTSEIL
jgi:hypothetical protein